MKPSARSALHRLKILAVFDLRLVCNPSLDVAAGRRTAKEDGGHETPVKMNAFESNAGTQDEFLELDPGSRQTRLAWKFALAEPAADLCRPQLRDPSAAATKVPQRPKCNKNVRFIRSQRQVLTG